MQIELNIDNHKRMQLPISQYDAEYYKLLREQAGMNANEFELVFHSNSGWKQTYKFPYDEILQANAIAEKFKGLDENSQGLRLGYAAHYRPGTVRQFINIIGLSDNKWIASVNNTKQLGEYVIEQRLITIPDELQPYIDEAKIGEKWLKDNNAFITGWDVYEKLTDEEKQALAIIPDTEPDIFDGAFIIAELKKGGNRVQLKFPCTEEALAAVIDEYCVSEDESGLLDNFRCRYQAHENISNYDCYSIRDIQEMSKALLPLTTAEYQKLNAVAEMHFCWMQDGAYYSHAQEAAVIIETANTLRQYGFYPPQTSYNEIFADYIANRHPEAYEEFRDCLDFSQADKSDFIANHIIVAPSGYIVCRNHDAMAQTQKLLTAEETDIQCESGGMSGMGGIQ